MPIRAAMVRIQVMNHIFVFRFACYKTSMAKGLLVSFSIISSISEQMFVFLLPFAGNYGKINLQTARLVS